MLKEALNINNLPKHAKITADVTAEHIKYLSENLRHADVVELLALDYGVSFYKLITASVGLSTECYTLLKNGIPVCIFGVVGILNVGVIWCLATHTDKLMLKHAPRILDLWQVKYKHLTNEIYVKNKLHINWLKKLGFVLEDKVDKTNFKVFYRV